MQNILSSIMEIGLKCSEELPNEKIDIKDVLVKLQKIDTKVAPKTNTMYKKCRLFFIFL
jgi:hypothetical protein